MYNAEHERKMRRKLDCRAGGMLSCRANVGSSNDEELDMHA